jgi:hypothetical protein
MSESATKVQEILGRIKARNFQNVRNRIENGQDCIELKATVEHGDWLETLLSSDVGYGNERTVQRDMQLAESLYHRLDELESRLSDLSWSSLVELTRKGAGDGAFDLALSLKDTMPRFTASDAKKVTSIAEHSWLTERVESGKVSLDDAYATATILKGASDSVYALAKDTDIRPNTLGAVAKLPQSAIDEFHRTQAIYNPATGKQVPIEDASPSDVETLIDYDSSERFLRQQEHIKRSMDEKNAQKGAREKLTFSGAWTEVRAYLESQGFTPDQPLDLILFVAKAQTEKAS